MLFDRGAFSFFPSSCAGQQARGEFKRCMSLKEVVSCAEAILVTNLKDRLDFQLFRVPAAGASAYVIAPGHAHAFYHMEFHGLVRRWWWETTAPSILAGTSGVCRGCVCCGGGCGVQQTTSIECIV